MTSERQAEPWSRSIEALSSSRLHTRLARATTLSSLNVLTIRSKTRAWRKAARLPHPALPGSRSFREVVPHP